LLTHLTAKQEFEYRQRPHKFPFISVTIQKIRALLPRVNQTHKIGAAAEIPNTPHVRPCGIVD